MELRSPPPPPDHRPARWVEALWQQWIDPLEAAFADPAETETMIGGLRLRPFSLGTLNVCRQLELTLFLDGEVELGDEEKQRQIVAFAWGQSAPLHEVLAALRTKTSDEKIEEFEFGLAVGEGGFCLE